MNHAQIEKKLMELLDELPDEAAREVLDFAQYLAQKSSPPKAKPRPLGLLRGKASYKLADDFSLDDEEFLNS